MSVVDISSITHSSSRRDEGQETRLRTMDASPSAAAGAQGEGPSLRSVQMDGDKGS